MSRVGQACEGLTAVIGNVILLQFVLSMGEGGRAFVRDSAGETDGHQHSRRFGGRAGHAGPTGLVLAVVRSQARAAARLLSHRGRPRAALAGS